MTIPRTETFLEVGDGDRVWVETAGSGPDLVLCHGLGGNAAVWYQQVAHFATSFRVITWDQRGFGRSSNSAGRHGPVTAAADLAAILDHFSVSRAHLVGQSMGGWAALGAALAEPTRVASLVLACTTAGVPVVRERADADSARTGAAPARPLGHHPALGSGLPDRDLARAYLYQALGTFGDRPPDGELIHMLAATNFDAESLGGLRVPILMVAGENDPLMTPALIREASTWLPGARVTEFPGVGHSPYFEDPKAWNAVVESFLADVER